MFMDYDGSKKNKKRLKLCSVTDRIKSLQLRASIKSETLCESKPSRPSLTTQWQSTIVKPNRTNTFIAVIESTTTTHMPKTENRARKMRYFRQLLYQKPKPQKGYLEVEGLKPRKQLLGLSGCF